MTNEEAGAFIAAKIAPIVEHATQAIAENERLKAELEGLKNPDKQGEDIGDISEAQINEMVSRYFPGRPATVTKQGPGKEVTEADKLTKDLINRFRFKK